MSITPVPLPKPLRIKKLSLSDFRAFPGPAAAELNLDGKNLLVCGENGSGKSSIFYALNGFFSLKQGRTLGNDKNVFSGEPVANCKVSVEFDNGIPPTVDWTIAIHPASTATGADQRVTSAALRKACLDYRAILDTNYLHGTAEINLFQVAVNHLLRDYPYTPPGGVETTIGELWEKVVKAKPNVQSSGSIAKINEACIEFNAAFRSAFPTLLPLIKELMDLLGCGDVEIQAFRTPGVTYNKAHQREKRRIEGQVLTPEVTFRSHAVRTPQSFLNEARLSALGLSIYLSGRLACTPTAPSSALKLLVLDDVLIGLDHSNRLPVLNLLRTKFADWQIVLLTFDRVWFEMARFYIGNDQQWGCLEVFEGNDLVRGIPFPIVRQASNNASRGLLNQAREFLTANHISAAANYTRAAFELGLKSFCEKFSVPVAYSIDPRHLDTEKLSSAIESWLKTHQAKACFSGVIERVKLFRKVVLNPYSHSTPPNISKSEVQGAIEAIGRLLDVLRPENSGCNPLEAAQSLILKAALSAQELYAALGYLRIAFAVALMQFCERKNLNLKFRNSGHDSEALWRAVLNDQARLFPAIHNGVPGQIDAERRWLISPVSDADLAAITHADLTRILGVLVPAGANRMVLESI